MSAVPPSVADQVPTSRIIPLTATLAACYFIITGAIPIIAILCEFGIENGWFMAKNYYHLFMYPLFFGFIPAALVVFPLALLSSLTKGRSILHLILTLSLVLSLTLTVIDYSGDTAAFELSPPVLGTMKVRGPEDKEVDLFTYLMEGPASNTEQEAIAKGEQKVVNLVKTRKEDFAKTLKFCTFRVNVYVMRPG